jgi:hypothetical protein
MKFLDLDGLKYYHQALSDKFNLTPYSKKTETVKDIEVYNPNFVNDDDDTPSNTSIRIELADGTHKYVNVPEASGPYKVGTFTFPGNAGFMSISDKTKLDDIPSTYLPLSGGIMTGTLYISCIEGSINEGLSIVNVAGIAHTDQDKFSIPEVWTTDASSIPLNKANGIPTLNADGKIDESKIDNLSGYVSSQNGNIYSEHNVDDGDTILNISGDSDIEGSGGRIRLRYTEDGKGKISTIIDGKESSVNAEKFNSIINPNKNEVWSTNGGRIDVLNLLSNAAIYVEGEITRAAGSINYNDVINYPNSIVFDTVTGIFYAKKDDKLYTHWNAYLQKNIYPPEKYGAVVDNYVYPIPKQIYKFKGDNNLYISSYLNNVATMTIFTIN